VEVTNRGLMDANKDTAAECLRIAASALGNGDLARATKVRAHCRRWPDERVHLNGRMMMVVRVSDDLQIARA
jgi:hypothetical protein